MTARLVRAGTAALLVLVALLGLGTTSALAQDVAEEEAEEGAAVFGTLRAAGEPVSGVTIVVSDADGEPVGEATSNDEGMWRVPVPGPGSYEVQLQEDTLPEEAGLREGATNPLQIQILSDSARPAVFQLGEAAGSGVSILDDLLQRTVNGLKIGLIIAITSIGLSLIFGTTGLINFAHGELVSLGAIIAWFLNREGPQLPLVWAGTISVGLMGGVGAALEKGLFKPLRERKVGLFQMLVITIGLSLLLQNILLLWFGGGFNPYGDYVGQKALTLGPVSIVPRDLWIMVLSAIILVGIATMLQRTRMGKAMRAVADNKDLAESSGINVERVILVVWVLGVALAAIGGIFTGVIFQVDFRMGFRLLLLMFAGVILGGLGTAYGAIVGGIVVGLATELSTIWFRAELKNAWALLLLIVVLLFRPQGILGKKERIG